MNTRFLPIVTSVLFLLVFSSSLAAQEPIVGLSQDSNRSMLLKSEGALPEKTPAESDRENEKAVQAKLDEIGKAVTKLSENVEAMRSTVTARTGTLEKLEKEKQALQTELALLAGNLTSPVTRIQYESLQQRLDEVSQEIENIKGRLDKELSVFGEQFFKSGSSTALNPSAVPSNYELRTGDSLLITTTSSIGAQSSYDRAVDSNGNISVPGAGTVYASGLTVRELQSVLADKISAKFPQISVKVTVKKMATISVQVTGDANRPATYTLSGVPTVMDALYAAGGPSKNGSYRKIRLSSTGRPTRTVDLYDFLLYGKKDSDYVLHDGDSIFIPSVGDTVTITGQVKRPGRYEPESPIGLAEAIKMAGGLQPAADKQSVSVERIVDGRYRVLLNKRLSGGQIDTRFKLASGDIVSVNKVFEDTTNRVEIKGPVKVPGIYGLSDGMRVSELVEDAQGLSDEKEVYPGRADILRIDPFKGHELITINLEKALSGDDENDIVLKKLDRLYIYEPDQIVFRPKVVTVSGPVSVPGTYRRTEGMRVSDLVAAAGGTLPAAYLSRADLVSVTDDESTILTRVDLKEALTGDPEKNPVLKNRDELRVYSISSVCWSDRTVRVEGAVQRPGEYVRSENMRVSDLLFQAGGLLPEAGNRAELAQTTRSGESQVVAIDLTRLANDEYDKLLGDRDLLTVPSVNPLLRSPHIVYILGEVANPGPYALESRDDKISDIVKRAGGLTELANTDGTLFLREKDMFDNEEQQKDVDKILVKSRLFANKQMLMMLSKMGVTTPPVDMLAKQQETERAIEKPEEVTDSKVLEDAPGTEDVDKTEDAFTASNPAGLDETADAGRETALGGPVEEADANVFAASAVEKMDQFARSARISVDLDRAIADPSSADNMPLRNGDRIYIPKQSSVVTVVGAVLHPHAFAAGPGRDVNYYLQKSGGFAPDAAKKYVTVVRANGDAFPQRMVGSVQPGDVIVVPTSGLIDVATGLEKTRSITQVLSEILSTVFIITKL